MGNYLRIFRRRRPPSEQLDELVLQITELESQLKQLLDSRAWSLKWLVMVTFFLISTTSAYYWLQYRTVRHKSTSIFAVVSIGSLSFLTLRFIIMALYDWLISRKQKRIRFFTEQKVAIIEDVKENEKFKVAKEIIEKYGTKSEVKELFGPTTSDNKLTNGRQNNICTDLKKRRIESEEGASTSMKEDQQKQSSKSVPKLYEIRDSGHPFYTNRAPIRPFVEASRTPIDRVLDFVMGENISNRYALICVNCHSHNGMALREEFETISYYCFRCNFFNPSKAELNKRFLRLKKPLDFTGNTDESTENEAEYERKASTASLITEASEREDIIVEKNN